MAPTQERSETKAGGAKKPELAKLLCENSGADVEWLMDKFNLGLSLVARHDGHSTPGAHRGRERFPGHRLESLTSVQASPATDRYLASGLSKW